MKAMPNRYNLPIVTPETAGLTTYDAKDADTAFPPIEPLLPPAGAPNVLIVLLDDTGFGASNTFGGPVNTPPSTGSPPQGCATTGSTPLPCVH
jgi:arylsulfatase